MVETVEGGVGPISEPVRNAPCSCLLNRETVLEEGEREKRKGEEAVGEEVDKKKEN